MIYAKENSGVLTAHRKPIHFLVLASVLDISYLTRTSVLVGEFVFENQARVITEL
jgi:hypothetical protein